MHDSQPKPVHKVLLDTVRRPMQSDQACGEHKAAKGTSGRFSSSSAGQQKSAASPCSSGQRSLAALLAYLRTAQHVTHNAWNETPVRCSTLNLWYISTLDHANVIYGVLLSKGAWGFFIDPVIAILMHTHIGACSVHAGMNGGCGCAPAVSEAGIVVVPPAQRAGPRSVEEITQMVCIPASKSRFCNASPTSLKQLLLSAGCCSNSV